MAEVITPKGKLDLASAAGLHSELGALKGRDVVLDLHAATQLGALCLQVLVAACKTAREAGTTFRVTGANPRVAANLATMGMPAATLTEGLS